MFMSVATIFRLINVSEIMFYLENCNIFVDMCNIFFLLIAIMVFNDKFLYESHLK